jgi:hypothetical protein
MEPRAVPGDQQCVFGLNALQHPVFMAFPSEAGTGSREESALKQKA